MNQLEPIIAAKFRDPQVTADGSPRAHVALETLDTLWFNTGTLCNLTCANCYIESSPTNDQLVYLTHDDVVGYLDEIDALGLGTQQIGLTGGEPFMNPDILPIIETALDRGFEVLVLTNAMKPMQHKLDQLTALKNRLGTKLVIRVSLDHHTQALHEQERGVGAWAPAIAGLRELRDRGFTTHVAGRSVVGESEAQARLGYAALIETEGLDIDAFDPSALVLFPEMDAQADVPEITDACWNILSLRPEDQMCASSRMVVKRKGADLPVVLSCTLIAYDPAFEMGHNLAESLGSTSLNHPFCAQFCVLGGASCAG